MHYPYPGFDITECLPEKMNLFPTQKISPTELYQHRVQNESELLIFGEEPRFVI